MKRRRGLPALAIAMLSSYCAATYAEAPAIPGDCDRAKGADRIIAACTEALVANAGDARALVKRGFAYFVKFDYDRAYADYEAAIRQDPKDADGYRHRGMIFQIRSDDDRAIADFNKALELGSKDPMLHVDRGNSYAATGAGAKSIADYSKALEIDAKNPPALLLRGIAYTYVGDFEKAQADFKRGFEVDPKFPYFLIWLHIAERRAGKPSSLASSVSSISMTRWPAQVVRMFLGDETPEAVLARASTKEADKPYGACESDFYVAEYKNLQGQRDEAVRLYKASQQSCRRNFFEWVAATAALRSM